MVLRQAGVAVGAGVASALLFVVSAKGTAFASLMAYFTALPIIIAALSFGHLSGLGGALVGLAGVTVATSPILGAFFLLCFALPGWWLAFLALLARPAAEAGPGSSPPARPPALLWYPVGRLMTWVVAMAVGAVLLVGAAAVFRYGGFDEASARLAVRLNEVMGPSAGRPRGDDGDFGTFLVRILPLAMAASLVPMLGINLWLGARIAQTSQRLTRPWPNVPDGLDLPRAVAGVFLASLLPALVPGPVGTVCGTVAAALGIAFAFQGLATAHVLTRGFSGRRAVLGLIYIVTLVVPLALVALTLIGVLDSLFSLRDRRPPAVLKS